MKITQNVSEIPTFDFFPPPNFFVHIITVLLIMAKSLVPNSVISYGYKLEYQSAGNSVHA